MVIIQIKLNSFKSYCEKIYVEDKENFLKIFEILGYQHYDDAILNEQANETCKWDEKTKKSKWE